MPIQQCDALSRHVSKNHETQISNCNAHARRKFYELVDVWPKAVTKIIGLYGNVFINEKLAPGLSRGVDPLARIGQIFFLILKKHIIMAFRNDDLGKVCMHSVRWILYHFVLSGLLIFSQQIQGENGSNSSIIRRLERNTEILNRVPVYFWNEDKYVFHWGNKGKNPLISKGGYQSKGAAGVIPYIIYGNKTYVLLARETWGRDKNTYCDLGGAVEVYETRNSPVYADTFLFTLLKEGEEESGGLYKFTEYDFLEKAYVVSHIYCSKLNLRILSSESDRI